MARRASRAEKITAAVIIGVAGAVVLAVLLLTQTDWGRRHVLAFGLTQLADRVHGHVRIADIHGNLLSGARLDQVVITDTAGRPFLRADTVRIAYSIRSLLRNRLMLHDVRLVNALLVLDQPPGEEWNYARIFPTGAPKPHRGPGFGSWIQIRNFTIRNSTVVVRATWTPPKDASPAERRRAIRAALSAENRLWVVPYDSGYQSISEFLNVNGHFPFMRLAEPDSVNRLIVADSLRMFALPFRSPGVAISNLAASAIITKDSAVFNNVRILTRRSIATGVGAYALNGDGARIQLHLPRASSADARWLRPDVPPGSGSLDLAMTSHHDRKRIVASKMDVHSEGATIRGTVDVQLGKAFFRVGPSDVAFANLDSRVVRRYATRLPLADGTMSGHLQLAGSPAAMRIDGKLDFTERRGPTSRVVANGVLGETDHQLYARGLRLRFDPLHLSLLRKYEPRIPYRGALTGYATITGSARSGFSISADVIDRDPRTAYSHVLANGRIESRNGFAARNLKLRFKPLQVAMLQPFVRELPYGGTIAGSTTLTGSRRTGFDIVADVVHDSDETGRSHITTNGWVGVVNGLSARALKLGFQPLQIAAVKPFAPALKLDGTVTGSATLTGSMNAQRIASSIDLVHEGSTGTSRAIGRANLAWGRRGYYDVDLRVPTVSLPTIGRYMPGAGLRGEASGTIEARGRASTLMANVNLQFAENGGSLRTRGAFDVSRGLRRYDFTSTLAAFNAGKVSTRAPQTLLTGVIVARGRGTDPATTTATIAANLIGSRAPGLPLVDSAIVRARVANGLAAIEQGKVRLSSARGDFSGSFGLVANRSGTLRYAFEIDTLSHFITLPMQDTIVIRPRPLVQARRVAQAREDSARIARATEVQRAAVGYPPPPALVVDTVRAIRRDTVRGYLRAEGTITGNVRQFDTQGSAWARNLVIKGHYIGRGITTYDVRGYGTKNMKVAFDAFGDTVRLAGFAFDSMRAKVDYTGVRRQGSGHADLAFFQDPQRDYRVRSDFDLALDRKRLELQTLTMRFDTTVWHAVHPAVIGWGEPGITVDKLELRSTTGGSLRADGRLPTAGSADLMLDVERLQIGDITALLQDTGSARGLLTMHTRFRGTRADPSIAGDVALIEGAYRGTVLPEIRGKLAYADRNLTSRFDLFRNTTKLATADVHLPVNLALNSVTGPRFMRDAPLQVDLKADSLPLDAVPSFTTLVSNVRGRMRGNISVRGSMNHPKVAGLANLDLGAMRITPTGVLYNDIAGSIRLRGDTAYIDSLLAWNGGPIRATGRIDFATLTRPGFDLRVAGRNAVLIDNYRGRIRADIDLAVKGPYDGVHVTGDTHILGDVVYIPETRNRRVTNLEDPTLRASVDTAGLGLAILPQPNRFMRNLQVDVNVRIDPDTWARNLQTNVEIYTPNDAEPLRIHMDNAHQVLTLTGVINADRGEYTFAGRNFQLSTGSATFLGGPTIDPFLNITARHEVRRKGVEALVIQIHVDGNLRRPRVTLASNAQPPLSQSDLLSYLAFGQAASSVTNLATSSAFGVGNGGLSGLPALAQQQLASVALGATIDQVVAQIEREGTRNGLDVFRVHAGELPAEAAFQSYFRNIVSGTEIEAGKYITPRLFLEARGRTNTTPGLSVQYRGQLGLTWTGTWEPRYMPVEPSLATTTTAARRRTLGLLLLWQRRY